MPAPSSAWFRIVCFADETGCGGVFFDPPRRRANWKPGLYTKARRDDASDTGWSRFCRFYVQDASERYEVDRDTFREVGRLLFLSGELRHS